MEKRGTDLHEHNGPRRIVEVAHHPGTSNTDLNFGGLLPTPDGVVIKSELVLTNHGTAVFIAHVGDHIHVRSPELELTLPVDDGRERGAHQEWPL